jgi:hypothetical protein
MDLIFNGKRLMTTNGLHLSINSTTPVLSIPYVQYSSSWPTWVSSGLNISDAQASSSNEVYTYFADSINDNFWYLTDNPEFTLVMTVSNFGADASYPWFVIWTSTQPTPLYQQQITGDGEFNFTIPPSSYQELSMEFRNFEYTGFAPVPADCLFVADISLSLF